MSFWNILKAVFLVFVPLPVYPRLNRPDPTKNVWTFECLGFTSVYQEAKPAFQTLWRKCRALLNVECPAPATPPTRPPTRRSSIRPGEGADSN